MNEIERRFLKRSQDNARASGRIASGHAAIFDSPAEIGGEYVEVLRRGCFARSLREKHDVKLLMNHDPNLICARTGNGSLQLKEDDRGLHFRADVVNTAAGDDFLKLLGTRTIVGCSFAFAMVEGGETWSYTTDARGQRRHLREIRDCSLYDVSAVVYPTYAGTDVDIEDDQAGLMALAAVARSSGAPLELRSRIQHVLESSAMSPRERDLYSRALLLETE